MKPTVTTLMFHEAISEEKVVNSVTCTAALSSPENLPSACSLTGFFGIAAGNNDAGSISCDSDDEISIISCILDEEDDPLHIFSWPTNNEEWFLEKDYNSLSRTTPACSSGRVSLYERTFNVQQLGKLNHSMDRSTMSQSMIETMCQHRVSLVREIRIEGTSTVSLKDIRPMPKNLSASCAISPSTNIITSSARNTMVTDKKVTPMRKERRSNKPKKSTKQYSHKTTPVSTDFRLSGLKLSGEKLTRLQEKMMLLQQKMQRPMVEHESIPSTESYFVSKATTQSLPLQKIEAARTA